MMMIMKMTMMMIIVMLMIINIDITITLFIIDHLIFSKQSASCPILQTSHFNQVSARVCLFGNHSSDNNNYKYINILNVLGLLLKVASMPMQSMIYIG